MLLHAKHNIFLSRINSILTNNKIRLVYFFRNTLASARAHTEFRGSSPNRVFMSLTKFVFSPLNSFCYSLLHWCCVTADFNTRLLRENIEMKIMTKKKCASRALSTRQMYELEFQLLIAFEIYSILIYGHIFLFR